MEIWQLISTDVDFDNAYGDVSFIGDQISIPNSKNRVLKQVILDRVKSGFNDYYLYPTYGADIDSYIGQGIDEKMIPKVESSIMNALVGDNFLSTNSVDIYSVILNSTLYTRIYVLTAQDTRISVGVTYSTGDLVIE